MNMCVRIIFRLFGQIKEPEGVSFVLQPLIYEKKSEGIAKKLSIVIVCTQNANKAFAFVGS